MRAAIEGTSYLCQLPMAAVAFGLALPLASDSVSDSSSPHSTAASSESPMTATRLFFNATLASSSPDEPVDGDVVVPKIEEIEDEELDQPEAKPLPSPPEEEDSEHHAERATVKRPRGRPRKHPKDAPVVVAKPLKGRSKTGCVTCRRRKKKCDETKPACESHHHSHVAGGC